MKRRILFPKCFNYKEPRKDRTYKFSSRKKMIFEKNVLDKISKGYSYQDTLNSLPKAFFVVIRKRQSCTFTIWHGLSCKLQLVI